MPLTVEQRFTRANPRRVIGDRVYDSDPLDRRLRQKHRIRLIAPHKYNCYRQSTQDGRELCRYLPSLENRTPFRLTS
jgi:hypothetical protein